LLKVIGTPAKPSVARGKTSGRQVVGLWTKLFPQALNFIQKIVFQNSII
jgi:hypothetical protein